jgi:hypothetical protein
MKKITYILLFYFVAFSIAPTIISLLKSKYEISHFYNILEEEQNQEQKEELSKKTFEDVFINTIYIDLLQFNSNLSGNFYSFYNETLNCNFLCNIIIPPPNTI